VLLCGWGEAPFVSAGSSFPIAVSTEGGAASAAAAGQLALFGSTLAPALVASATEAEDGPGFKPGLPVHASKTTGVSAAMPVLRDGPLAVKSAGPVSEPYRTAAHITPVAAMNISLWE
jgi:hypothetical protein